MQVEKRSLKIDKRFRAKKVKSLKTNIVYKCDCGTGKLKKVEVCNHDICVNCGYFAKAYKVKVKEEV